MKVPREYNCFSTGPGALEFFTNCGDVWSQKPIMWYYKDARELKDIGELFIPSYLSGGFLRDPPKLKPELLCDFINICVGTASYFP